jgi:hypothetical protein
VGVIAGGSRSIIAGASRTLAGLGLVVVVASCGRDQPAGVIEGSRRPTTVVEVVETARATARRVIDQRAMSPPPAPTKRILFGDLHVHTSYSIDAFVFSLPAFGGEGTHPPADACDFARYCSAIDFFSINDHAEGLTPERWQRTKDSIRDCNSRAGDPRNPDLVAFVGWEWTQVGATPETHYGHKNVMFRDLADDELPARPITSLPDRITDRAPPLGLLRAVQLVGPFGLQGYADFFWLIEKIARTPTCPPGVDTRELSLDCRENASTPAELFRKLDQWGFDALVIPHGLSWGLHAPPGARLDNQLSRTQHDPGRQRLLEVFSGHGNAEEYRPWREFQAGNDESRARQASAKKICPEPTSEYLPCCWQAGEIVRARCSDLPPEECESRVEEARRLALEAGEAPHLVFPDAQPEEWLDCDQCRDCFKPTFALRPRETAQYSLAISAFDDRGVGPPLRFRWGFISSSDNHTARPGTGYKQYARRRMTEANGVRSKIHDWVLRSRIMGKQQDPRRAQPGRREQRSFGALLDVERVASFMYPGGLVAVHADDRSREAIWDGLERREVYGTSGPRILLWFDCVNGPTGRVPMGSAATMSTTPRFEVRAVGAFVQRPGCPEESVHGLAAERLDRLCRGECYNPSDERHPIVAIEVVRVRPQARPGEPVDALIDDPWRRFECPPDPSGCRVTFEDPDYPRSGRDTVYYARALQSPTPAVNGRNLRTAFDADGKAVRVSPCHGNYRTPFDDDCLAPVQERAWSSPIFLDQPRGSARR